MGHEFYEEEKDKRKWRGGRVALQQAEDIRKVLDAALRVANKALQDQVSDRADTLQKAQASQSESGGGSILNAEEENDLASDPSATTDVVPTARSKSKEKLKENVDNQAWGGTDTVARINLTWEEASYWLQVLLRKHAETPSENLAPLEPPARWDPERPTRTFFEKQFKNANDKTVDLKDPRFHLVVQDASAEDMNEQELMAQIEAERTAKGSAGPSNKKQRKDAALAPGVLKKSRLRGNASQRKQERVWLYKPKERLETTHAKLLHLQTGLPGKEHEVAFLRQKLVEVQAAEADADPNNAQGDPSTADDSNMQVSAAAECQICYELKEQIGVLPCYHSFCIDCIETICKSNLVGASEIWRDRRGPKCPSCRLHFHPNRVTRVMERGRSMSTEGESEVVGDWSGKISGLILDLKARLREDSTHKAVIFSHWPKMLAFVRDALVQNDIAAVVFGGNEASQAEALRAIRDDDEVNAILVPFRASAGAAGLTLTSCDLAYLMEPALDAALEAQAIGRINRIGQRRETTILRVKMKDTIEDAVMRIADERSQRGMALATHANPKSSSNEQSGTSAPSTSAASTSAPSTSAPNTSTTANGAAASTSRGANTSTEAPTIRIKVEESDTLPLASPASTKPSLRERSIKASVAASVGAAGESDNTSLTMTEAGLILGFDVAEERRKEQARRENIVQRAFNLGLVRHDLLGLIA